jgi:putative transposase
MSRASRYFPGGMVYHVLNRGVGRRTLFDKDQDFLAFERVIEEALRTCPMRICAFCTLSNHFLCEASHNQCYVKLEIM